MKAPTTTSDADAALGGAICCAGIDLYRVIQGLNVLVVQLEGCPVLYVRVVPVQLDRLLNGDS
eukprot:CAMPEP_0181402400 /NCGR_PEP_ID=MMETSP1110-20121109/3153_1 /TAXON_ID=174948 /ORGANISM="Symbiodinium sp., Strain CCMP421" /LENGTH=62 /DNA_ID=CAMNT_0023524613 /DNA_START=382 /DNA_END=570 /DNA_ORIENTATION=+